MYYKLYTKKREKEQIPSLALLQKKTMERKGGIKQSLKLLSPPTWLREGCKTADSIHARQRITVSYSVAYPSIYIQTLSDSQAKFRNNNNNKSCRDITVVFGCRSTIRDET